MQAFFKKKLKIFKYDFCRIKGRRISIISNMLTRYIIYGFLGWNVEIIWTGLNSLASGSKDLIGHTSIWMFFIYGTAVFVLEPIHYKIAEFNWLFRGIIWMFLIFAIEMISGLALKLIGVEAWHYYGPTSILGIIRIDYAPLWFILGLVFEKIHNVLISYQIGIK